MTATPQFATAVFIGLRTRKSYHKDIYLSDVNGALVTWDAGNGASSTSPSDWTPPEAVLLRDVSIVTGTADTTKIRLTRNGVATGDILRYSIHLTSLANRPQLQVGFNALEKITAIQMT